MIRPILIYGDPKLTILCAPVPVSGFNTNRLSALIQDLKDTCVASNGAGLAAPQIGSDLRVIVFRKSLYVGKEPTSSTSPTPIVSVRDPFTVIINPTTTHQQGKRESEEGCLSIPGWKATVHRPETVVVEGFDAEGKPVRVVGTGFLASVLCREIDHLDGRLFIHYLGDKHCKLAKEFVERRAKKEIQEAPISPLASPSASPSLVDEHLYDGDEIFERHVISDGLDTE